MWFEVHTAAIAVHERHQPPSRTRGTAKERPAAALAKNPRAAYAAIVAIEDSGDQAAADNLAAAIIAAGGRIPDGTEFMPDHPPAG